MPTLDDECDDMFTDSEKFSTARLTASEEPGTHSAKKEFELLQDKGKIIFMEMFWVDGPKDV